MANPVLLAFAATTCLVGSQHAAAQAPVAPGSTYGADALSGEIVLMPHISVQKIGKGTPVILIPGLSSPRGAWDGVAPALAKSHSVYLVQVNGFGGDDPGANLKPGVLNGVVADLADLIVRQKLKNPAIVGHSMGGLIGLMLAARHPRNVGRLMVVDALPWFGVLMVPPGTEATVAMLEPRAAQMRDAVAASHGKPPSRAAAEANVAALARKPESRAKAVEWAMAADPRVTAQAMYEDLTTDLRPELNAITAPVTLVYAWNEQYPRKDQAEAFFRAQYAALAHATYVGVGDSAHFVMLDQSEAFRAALDAFLAG
ncbi:alpha/beta hydrolase [Sphingomonas psychrotolerans]|uniref:Alpha/beta hydrolase n=1 Tax=Sphingomonas psychrotolerans TaxID=1327635 RepID=A0ABU3N2L5_9SPHN|nr:alpha/beta hydrolase [Sphingomonas psychrotolerans]MDT8758794.1 alpha/beta hydrolase [Sphingomonas psychrotolerans]